jgi:signal transduction histidine kinase
LPSTEASPLSRLRHRLPRTRLARRLLPRSFRARLAVVISAVVAFALILVLAVLPRLLDSYFSQQETQNLQARAAAVQQLLGAQLSLTARAGLVPIVAPTNPPQLSSQVMTALAVPDEASERSFLSAIADLVAQANVTVRIYDTATPTGTPVATLNAPLTVNPGQGLTRESGSVSGSFTIADRYWSQSPGTAPVRAVVVTLSSPYTLRAETLRTLFTVLIAVAVLALLFGVVVSAIVADRLTTPIRRLTSASRALAEGDFSARVAAASSGSPEITELATAFNRMADELERSIEFIRRDRDRGREFLADVSHELRTPIAALRMFNELLTDGAANDTATRTEFLETSRVQIERLDWLSSNLLELSKLDSGLVALDVRPDDLRTVVESAMEQARPTAERKGVTLTADVPPAPFRFPHDPPRMGQVVGNLVGNAVKFTPAGGSVTVSLVRTRDLARARDGARITVQDTGVGIDADELPHVFERFYRGSRANEIRASGSGLGLAIARSIVEMHGGRISIASRLGQGTQVDVFLPRRAEGAEVMESSPPAALPVNTPVSQ